MEREVHPYSSLLPPTFGGDGTEIQACSRTDVVVELEGVPDADEPTVEKNLT